MSNSLNYKTSLFLTKRNKMIKKNLLRITMMLMASVLLYSCYNSEPSDSPYVDDPEEIVQKESTILIYAVATNSLQGNLVSDKEEMLKAASQIDLKSNNILLSQTVYYRDETEGGVVGINNLLKLVKEDEDYGWELVKEYDRETASLNPSRISEVIDYATTNFPADSYGIIFWSHSTASQPYISSKGESLPMQYSFGQDLTTPEPEYEQLNIELLADALPDNFFKFIWFDSCYMSNIESIYEMRNKCETYIGYPTEVLEYGLPYDLVLPYLVGNNPDLVGGAETFFNFYAKHPYSSLQIATIAVVDMAKIEALAEYCNEIYSEGNELESVSGLHRFTRGSTGPFYDFGDYTKAMAELAEKEVSDEEWNEVLDNCVIYKAATPYDFSGKYIDPERYSGISTHVYQFSEENDKELYYRSLDWYNRVF